MLIYLVVLGLEMGGDGYLFLTVYFFGKAVVFPKDFTRLISSIRFLFDNIDLEVFKELQVPESYSSIENLDSDSYIVCEETASSN